MEISLPDPDDRTVAIIGLVQTFLLIAGTMYVAAMLKFWGYGADVERLDIEYRAGAIFVRNYGPWLLLLPVGWVALTLFTTRRVSDVRWSQGMILLGLLTILAAVFELLILGAMAGHMTGPFRS